MIRDQWEVFQAHVRVIEGQLEEARDRHTVNDLNGLLNIFHVVIRIEEPEIHL